MKVDVFCHFFPKRFYERMLAISEKGATMQKRVRGIPAAFDLEARFPDHGSFSRICAGSPVFRRHR